MMKYLLFSCEIGTIVTTVTVFIARKIKVKLTLELIPVAASQPLTIIHLFLSHPAIVSSTVAMTVKNSSTIGS